VHQADTIVVLEAGKVVESGPHRSLLNQGGLYQKLYEYQLMPRRSLTPPLVGATGAAV
jgi:ATP-binding cassette subfamily B protein